MSEHEVVSDGRNRVCLTHQRPYDICENEILKERCLEVEAKLTALRDRVEGVSEDEIKNVINDFNLDQSNTYGFERNLIGVTKAIQDLYKSKLVK